MEENKLIQVYTGVHAYEANLLNRLAQKEGLTLSEVIADNLGDIFTRKVLNLQFTTAAYTALQRGNFDHLAVVKFDNITVVTVKDVNKDLYAHTCGNIDSIRFG